MLRVLIADNDLDSHELVDDLVEMMFRDVHIDRALSKESLFVRLGSTDTVYDLILFNSTLEQQEIDEVIAYVTRLRPELLKVMVFITSGTMQRVISSEFPVITRPFSLDVFSETIKKICAI